MNQDLEKRVNKHILTFSVVGIAMTIGHAMFHVGYIALGCFIQTICITTLMYVAYDAIKHIQPAFQPIKQMQHFCNWNKNKQNVA
jgi:hypothetical protein